MTFDEFLRLFPLRAPNLMWFLGAGASAAAGMPTAYDLIWEFKRVLYCSRERIPISRLGDLSNEVLRRHLQGYFDATGEFPKQGDPSEYAAYFEAAYPNEGDRRRELDRMVSAASPTYGHLVLARLMSMGMVRIVWTTNFDHLIEDAATRILGTTTKFTVATLGEPDVAQDAINDGRWPLVVKLHGDFQSRRLKNTPSELQQQDALLRQAFAAASQRFGLIVIGYSGRDESIMDTLDEALTGANPFPHGLFWFHRGEQPPAQRVLDLIEQAKSSGVQAALLPIETFDEFMGDLSIVLPDLQVDDLLPPARRRISDSPIPKPGTGWPVLRFNALAFTSTPEVVRRVDCDIGGTAEVRKAIDHAGVNVLAVRSRNGVLAFGSDRDVRAAFEDYGIREFDLVPIEPKDLANETAIWGLLYDALGRALCRELPLVAKRFKPPKTVAVDLSRSDTAILNPLRRAVGSLSGRIPGTDILWVEALRFRIEYRLNRLWFLIEPCIWVEGSRSDEAVHKFVLNRMNRRFNPSWNAILEAWVQVICQGHERTLRSLGITDGVDAVFTVSPVTAFSRRGASP